MSHRHHTTKGSAAVGAKRVVTVIGKSESAHAGMVDGVAKWSQSHRGYCTTA